MAKFHGRVGFGKSVEGTPGVFADTIVEHTFYGDVIQNRRILRQDENLNKDLSVGNSISIVANAFARGNFFAIRYVEWAGELWAVTDVDVQLPRLILQLGEVYNGPTAGTSVTP
ncbi:MAG: hypothetical protein ACJ8BW_02060 [Ktedonobacteraceae bacterium]|jgi:hypothetical protein